MQNMKVLKISISILPYMELFINEYSLPFKHLLRVYA